MKYNERIATKSMDPEYAHELVQLARRESKRCMAEREKEMDAGLAYLRRP